MLRNGGGKEIPFCTYPLDANSKISKRIGDDIMDVLSTIDQDEIEYREC